ncbi:MBL fold metallo-hydrolase [Thermus tenuipuniceus]|uniref:MBL fold metallo-hydrolase n=1 Tax=Thermus tenuipuniceus TaxID=2078690 RepID=UPI000CF894EC|nr:MBL fold metallo-hydrolase [Thermus tenuipuniceus]
MQVIPLWTGFPGRTHRGYLGASSAYVILASRTVLYDTLGFGEREGLYHRLKDLGIPPERVEVVVVSHLHFDHAANVDLFPQAEIVLHKLEWTHAKRIARNPLEDPACLYTLLPLLDQMRIREVTEGEEELLPGLRLLHLPGHTPGLLGLEVEGVGTLVSDALKSRFDLEGPPAPPCWNPQLALETRGRILQCPRILPGHDVPLVRKGNTFVAETQAELGFFYGGREVKLSL